MALETKHYLGCAVIALLLGGAVLIGGGWYWLNYVYDDPERAEQLAHEMADYEFPGEEVGVVSIDVFGWFRYAGTRASNGDVTLFLCRYPFTSESPAKVRKDIFSDMRKTVSATGPGEEKSWTVCNRRTTVVHRTGPDALPDGRDAHLYESCFPRGDAIFCTATLGFGAARSEARNLIRTLKCK